MWRDRRGQSMAEYALVVVMVIGAVVGMQTYYKRSLQAKIKGVVDAMNQDAGGGASAITQYEPYYASSTASTTQTSNDNEQYREGGTVSRTSARDVTQSVTRRESDATELTADDTWTPH